MKYVLLLLALALVSCGSPPEFSEYRGAAVTKGSGGMVRTVNGMDVWVEGTPPRTYRVIGMMHSEGGHHSDIDYETEQIVKAAKLKGADALIIANAESQPSGFAGYESGRAYPGPFGSVNYGGSYGGRILRSPSVDAVLIRYE